MKNSHAALGAAIIVALASAGTAVATGSTTSGSVRVCAGSAGTLHVVGKACPKGQKLYVLNLQGQVGQRGATGGTGAIGAAGATGATGATGSPGQQGMPGNQGIMGNQGNMGLQGNPASVTEVDATNATSTDVTSGGFITLQRFNSLPAGHWLLSYTLSLANTSTTAAAISCKMASVTTFTTADVANSAAYSTVAGEPASGYGYGSLAGSATVTLTTAQALVVECAANTSGADLHFEGGHASAVLIG